MKKVTLIDYRIATMNGIATTWEAKTESGWMTGIDFFRLIDMENHIVHLFGQKVWNKVKTEVK